MVYNDYRFQIVAWHAWISQCIIQVNKLWLLLIVTFSALSTNDGSIAYVRPSSTGNATCPVQSCLSFNDYAREKDRYFLDDTVFMFLSGVHQLDLRLRLVNVSSVSFSSLEGNGSVEILLGPMVNITWLDSNNVTITGLNIFLSGMNNMKNDESFSSLAFQNITSCLLSQLGFFGNDS